MGKVEMLLRYGGTQEEWAELAAQYKELLELFLEILPGLCLFVLVVALLVLLFVLRYKASRKKLRKDLAKIDMADMAPYLRDLPNNYSPSVVSVLQDHEEEITKDIPAELLNLCSKGYLEIQTESGSLERFAFAGTGKEDSALPPHERYVLHWILRNGAEFDFSRGFDVLLYRNMVVQEARRLNLLQVNENYHKQSNRKVKTHQIISLVLSIAIVLVGRFFYATPEKPMFVTYINVLPVDILANLVEYGLFAGFLFLFIQAVVLIFVTLPRIAGYESSSRSMLKRTAYGNEEYRKWMAFKSFLLDFSLIRERHSVEVVIWEFYLVYAVALGIADRVERNESAHILRNKAFQLANYTSFKNYIGSLAVFSPQPNNWSRLRK